jgi:sec-independent protein translocase protein TatC
MGLFTKRGDQKEGEMSFIGHISVLRWHLVRGVVVILILAGVAFCYPEIIFTKILFGPSRPDFVTYTFLCECSQSWGMGEALCFKVFDFEFQSIELLGQFSTAMWGSIVAGLVAGFPYLLWELWRFIKPALQPKEISAARGFIFYASGLFLLGVAFAYWIVSPMAVYFLGNYQIDPAHPIANEFHIDSYISVVTTLVLLMGLVFELPIIMYFLGRFGIVTAAFLRKYRKHAVIVILIISAVITPTTDVFTQSLVAFPLWILFEASIIVVARMEKRLAL